MVKLPNSKIVWTFFLLIFSSCVQLLNINEQKSFFLSTEGVKIKLNAESARGSHYILKVKSEKGNIEVNPDKLQLLYIYLENNKTIESTLYYHNKLIVNNFTLKEGESFDCKFSLISQDKTGKIYLVPSDFITYNGIPLAKDTIKISSFWSNI
jgi:hypothetical protein